MPPTPMPPDDAQALRRAISELDRAAGTLDRVWQINFLACMATLTILVLLILSRRRRVKVHRLLKGAAARV